MGAMQVHCINIVQYWVKAERSSSRNECPHITENILRTTKDNKASKLEY